RRLTSVLEVSLSGGDHCDSGRVGGRHHVGVLHRTARLDHGGDPGANARLQAVGKRKERVGGHDRAAGAVSGTLHRQRDGLQPRRAGWAASTIMFLRLASTTFASSRISGAITTWVTICTICSAVGRSSGRLVATTPPNADTLSHS